MVILGNPFMCLLYPFITNSEGITTHPFGQPVKFKFFRSSKPREISCLEEVFVSKTLNLISANTQHLKYHEDDLRHKKVEEQLACKNIQAEIRKFEEKHKQEVCSDLPTTFWHRKETRGSSPICQRLQWKGYPNQSSTYPDEPRNMDFCKAKIEDLLKKGIIRKSRSPWSCPAFMSRKMLRLREVSLD